MAEKHSASRLARPIGILQWFLVSFLAVLLILALVFRAPWKLTALLLAILAACTILPRRARRWFWLSVGIILVALIIWVFLPDDNQGWRPYTFDEELAALQAKYAVPDSENAAAIYVQLSEVAIFDENEPDFFIRVKPSLMQHFWFSKDHPQTAASLKKHEDTIAGLLEAGQMEKCRFPISADPLSDGRPTHHLPKMRRFAELLVCSANNDVGEGRIDEGLQKYFCALRMARHLYQQPTMIDILVGYAIEGISVRPLQRFVVTTDVAQEHLRAVEEALAEIEHDWASDLYRILEYERLWAKNVLCSLAYQVNSEGKVRLSRDPMRHLRAQWPEVMRPPTYWQCKRTKASTVVRWFLMPGTPQATGKAVDDSFQRYYAMAKPDYDWDTEPKRLMSLVHYITYSQLLSLGYRHFTMLIRTLSVESYCGIRGIYLRAVVNKRGTQLLIALRRYKDKTGGWAESLQQLRDITPAETLIDPVNGGPFVYRLTDDGFTLYSRGRNNVDEGGEYDADWAIDLRGGPPHVNVREDDILIWPPRDRETKEQPGDNQAGQSNG
jgi:hypothetical protein